MVDTYELCKTNDRLKQSVINSISNQFIVYETDKINYESTKGNGNILVSTKRTFEAASYYKGKRVAVLNFANNRNIGGAPYYANAQEEALCRCSTLLPCIEALEKEFYLYHKELIKSGKLDNYGNDDLIYTPSVVVFKSDTLEPKKLDESDWFSVDVITCAAPEMFYDYDEAKFRCVMSQRIKKILDVASAMKIEVLILGAFGCGVFRNPPHTVASIFKELLAKYSFETVEFAVYCGMDTANYDVFNNILSNRGGIEDER
jgi:uncharacterized protein (TIGR02452 family)